MSPRPSKEMMKQDAAIAWQRWAKQAPLDLLELFSDQGVQLEDVGVGPRLEHSLAAKAATLKDGRIKVELTFTPQDDEDEEE